MQEASAEVYFEGPAKIAKSNHLSIATPVSRGDDQYRLLSELCSSIETDLGVLTVNDSQPRFSADELKWEVRIDEDGDAENCFTFVGIKTNKEKVHLLNTWIQSGHSTSPSLHGQNSSSLELDVQAKGGNEAAIYLINLPSGSIPPVVVRNWNFNVYSLNMSEYNLKATYATQEIDYLEKTVDEVLGKLEIQVIFPTSMRLAKPVLTVLSKDGTVDQPLTEKYASNLDYSSVTKVARMSITRPKHFRAYRISWAIPESSDKLQNPITIESQGILSSFATSCLDEKGRAVLTITRLLSDYRKVLGKLLSQLQKHSREPALHKLDLSMMILDPRQRPFMLRQFWSEASSKQIPTSFSLGVGDSTPGRAYKRKMVMIFDARRAQNQPKENSYVEIPSLPKHQYLISVPMIREEDSLAFGVLNIGTFDLRDVPHLDTLSNHKSLKKILAATGTMLEEFLSELEQGELDAIALNQKD